MLIPAKTKEVYLAHLLSPEQVRPWWCRPGKAGEEQGQTLLQHTAPRDSPMHFCVIFAATCKPSFLRSSTPTCDPSAAALQLEAHRVRSCMIFVGTCKACTLLAALLEELGISATALHSKLSQRRRFAGGPGCCLSASDRRCPPDIRSQTCRTDCAAAAALACGTQLPAQLGCLPIVSKSALALACCKSVAAPLRWQPMGPFLCPASFICRRSPGRTPERSMCCSVDIRLRYPLGCLL